MKKFLSDKKRVAVAVIAIIIVLVAAAGIIMFSSDGKDSGLIFKGISISGIDVSAMTQTEAKSALATAVAGTDALVLNFECEGTSFSVAAGEIGLKADVEKAVTAAYNTGRTGKNSKKDISKAKKEGIDIALTYTFDGDKLLLTANDYLADKISDPSPMTVEIGDSCLIVKNATPGKVVSIDKALAAVSEELKDFKIDKPVSLVIDELEPKNLTFEEFKAEYLREAKDAVYTKDGDSHNIQPEVIGISFNEAEAQRILEENKDSKEPYEIPATITRPSVTAKFLEDKYVNKIMATYTTSFAGSSAGRCTNIALAASKINGYVLNPGERFSYNDVVGPRTADAGFKNAHVYVGTQVVDGIGGGICQVSSTLYNAVVLADLKTVSRTNHSMPVGYVPLGRDATVSYGTIDYIFENDKPYPVSIKATISGTDLTVSIVGTSEMDYTVEFVSAFNSTVAFGTVEREDATLPEGEQKVISGGSNGSVYDSYRVYKRNGVEFDRKYEAKSRYQPIAQIVAVGTLKENASGEEANADGQTENTEGEAVVPSVGEEQNGEQIPADENNGANPTEDIPAENVPSGATEPTQGQAGGIEASGNSSPAVGENTEQPVSAPAENTAPVTDTSSQVPPAEVPAENADQPSL